MDYLDYILYFFYILTIILITVLAGIAIGLILTYEDKRIYFYKDNENNIVQAYNCVEDRCYIGNKTVIVDEWWYEVNE